MDGIHFIPGEVSVSIVKESARYVQAELDKTYGRGKFAIGFTFGRKELYVDLIWDHQRCAKRNEA